MEFLRSLALLLGISLAGEVLERLIPLPVAAGIYGMLILLAGLISGRISLARAEKAGNFLLEIMPLLFVAPTVAIVGQLELLKGFFLPMLAISLATTILVFGITGKTADWLLGRGKGDGHVD